MTPTDAFRDAIRAAGLAPPDLIEPGRFQRFPGAGKRKGNTAGYCKLSPDGMGGIFGDFSCGLSETWQARQDPAQTFAEREGFREHVEGARAEADAKRREDQANAARKATELWERAKPTDPTHPYLVGKRIKPHGIRQVGDLLLVPMRDRTGELVNVQRIASDGAKRFLSGGRVGGCYHSIGKPNGTICIAEGYATGASIHEAVGHAVAVAFNSGNLEPVARELRAKYPDAKLIVCGDDDYRTEGNPGLTKATESARVVGGLIAVAAFGDGRPEGATDFNDMAQHQGAEALQRAIANARAPEVSDAQPGAESATAVDSVPVVELIRGSSITPRAYEWLWPGYLALGKLHVFAGAPGTGKTTIALEMLATVTRSGRWPDGTIAAAADVLIWSGEDSADDTLIPRLIVAGAHMDRVHIVRSVQEGTRCRPFDPSADIPALSAAASKLPNLRAVLVDSIASAVAGDSHNNSETRRGLQPLVDFAERHRCAILGVTHFTKGSEKRDPIERVTGSLAFGALARVVFGAAKLRDNEGGGRVFVRAKSNIGSDDGGFRYELERVELPRHPGIEGQRVAWGEAVVGSAREILAAAESAVDPDERGAVEEAAEFLRAELADGAHPAKEIYSAADQAGHSRASILRAKKALGIEPAKIGLRGPWSWSLPSKVSKDAEDAQPISQSTFGKHGEYVRRAADEGVQPTAEDALGRSLSTFEKNEHLRGEGDEGGEVF